MYILGATAKVLVFINLKVPYTGKLSREKSFANWKFAEKTFADGPNTSKFVKVFSLESFPLGNIEGNVHQGEAVVISEATISHHPR